MNTSNQQQNTQVQKKETPRHARLKYLVRSDDIQGRIASFLVDKNKREKFTATLINVGLDSSLVSCSPESIVKAGVQSAELDLSLNKNMGLAYIVRYKKDAEFQIGYKGWQLLAKRSGIRLNVTPIFDCDEFSLSSDGFDTTVKYIPDLDNQQDHNPEWVESHLKGVLVSTKENDEVSHRFVNIGKIRQIAGISPTRKSSYSPYSQWNLEMYMGKATKYVLSKMPMQEQIARAVEMENEVDKKRVADLYKSNKTQGDNIQDAEFVTLNVSDEDFAKCKENIRNGEVSLQDFCDNGMEFSPEQYAELEQLEQELQNAN